MYELNVEYVRKHQISISAIIITLVLVFSLYSLGFKSFLHSI